MNGWRLCRLFLRRHLRLLLAVAETQALTGAVVIGALVAGLRLSFWGQLVLAAAPAWSLVIIWYLVAEVGAYRALVVERLSAPVDGRTERVP